MQQWAFTGLRNRAHLDTNLGIAVDYAVEIVRVEHEQVRRFDSRHACRAPLAREQRHGLLRRCFDWWDEVQINFAFEDLRGGQACLIGKLFKRAPRQEPFTQDNVTQYLYELHRNSPTETLEAMQNKRELIRPTTPF